MRPGQGRGAEVGARTANLDVALADGLVKGLYSCEVKIAGIRFRGLLYYGINSLTGDDCLEVHVLAFEGELVGKEVVVKTQQYLRPEKKFATVAELQAQVRKDISMVMSCSSK